MSDLDDLSGLTPLDIADLPDDQRQVIGTFMHDAKGTAGILTLAALQDKHTDIEDLPGILADLTELNVLTRLGEEPNVRYKINFRRRRVTRLDSLWAKLSDDDNTDSDSSSDDDEQPNNRPSLPPLTDW